MRRCLHRFHPIAHTSLCRPELQNQDGCKAAQSFKFNTVKALGANRQSLLDRYPHNPGGLLSNTQAVEGYVARETKRR